MKKTHSNPETLPLPHFLIVDNPIKPVIFLLESAVELTFNLQAIHPMQKQTLKFPSFKELSCFIKTLSSGYLINTNTLTVTAPFIEFDIKKATETFAGVLIETNEKVYSYDPG